MSSASGKLKQSKTATKLATERGAIFLSLGRILHALVLLSNFTTLVYFLLICIDTINEPIVRTEEFFRHAINFIPYYFSLWVVALEYIYFGMYNIIDVLEIYSAKKNNFHQLSERMHHIASYLLFTFIFPLSTLVFLLFWSFYFYDRNLIYPPIMDVYLHPYVNHVMHTFPVPLCILYMFMSNKEEPSRSRSLSGLVAFLGVYSAIFFALKIVKGKYVYIGLEKLPPTQVPWILAFSAVSPIVFHTLGYKINNLVKRFRENIIKAI